MRKLICFTKSVSDTRFLSYRNQSIDLQSKSTDWFLYDRNLHHEIVNKKEGLPFLQNTAQPSF